MNKTDNFEEKILRIQDIVDTLEEGVMPLNEMIVLYEEGMKLSIECRDFLAKAELKVETISADYFKSKEN